MILLILRAYLRSIYLNLFSETKYKKQKSNFLSFSHSLALHTGPEKTRTTTLLYWDWLFDIIDLKSVQTNFTGIRLIL